MGHELRGAGRPAAGVACPHLQAPIAAGPTVPKIGDLHVEASFGSCSLRSHLLAVEGKCLRLHVLIMFLIMISKANKDA